MNDADAGLPALSVVEQETLVVAIGNVEPDIRILHAIGVLSVETVDELVRVLEKNGARA